MKVRGIKRGQNIEILEQLSNIPDGTEITIEVGFITNPVTEQKLLLTDEERLARLNQLFGAWKNQPELTEIFTELDQQRHIYQGRNIDSLDNQDNG